MASACVNNVGMLPEKTFLDCTSPYSSYGWFSPRISFSRDFVDQEQDPEEEEEQDQHQSSSSNNRKTLNHPNGNDVFELLQSGSGGSSGGDNKKDVVVFGGDFEFRLEEDPVKMLAADELFSDGKLVPLQLTAIRPGIDSSTTRTTTTAMNNNNDEMNNGIHSPPDTAKAFRRLEISDTDLYLFSPKAPRCSSRWKELLGLKKLQNSRNEGQKSKNNLSSSSNSSSSTTTGSSLKNFLHRNPKSDSSLSLPLLRDSSDSEILVPSSTGSSLLSSSSTSSSSSASSSSSVLNHDELHPRFSLDSDPKIMSQISLNRNPPRVRLAKSSRPPASASSSSENGNNNHHHHHQYSSRVGRSSMHRVPESNHQIPAIGLTIDSPRMNSSGKIVFQSLERSSSSPSTFNGGPRVKHRGVERSYSANVRVTPVLNVPVCSLRGSSKSGSVFGFGQLFSTPQKRDGSAIRSHSNRNRSSSSTTTTSTTTDHRN